MIRVECGIEIRHLFLKQDDGNADDKKNFSVCNIRIFHRIVGLCWWGLNINLGNGVMSDKANTCVDALQVSTDNIKPVLRQQISRVIHGWMHFIWFV